jgi:hypothetical protein
MATNQATWFPIPQGPEVLHVYHLRRSGGHGVIDWLMGHHQAEKIHYNQCKPHNKSPGIFVMKDMIARRPGIPQQRAFELASFEDIPLMQLRPMHRRVAATILLLRDPFNLFASRLQRARAQLVKPADASAELLRINTERWKSYAVEYMSRTILPEAIRVNFNDWYRDQEYRKRISGALGWSFTDEGFASRSSWNFSGGSSFGEKDPSRLDLLNRWQFFKEDAEFLSLVDDDLFDLTKLIFGFTPDLPRRNQSTGAAFIVQKQMGGPTENSVRAGLVRVPSAQPATCVAWWLRPGT